MAKNKQILEEEILVLEEKVRPALMIIKRSKFNSVFAAIGSWIMTGLIFATSFMGGTGSLTLLVIQFILLYISLNRSSLVRNMSIEIEPYLNDLMILRLELTSILMSEYKEKYLKKEE